MTEARYLPCRVSVLLVRGASARPLAPLERALQLALEDPGRPVLHGRERRQSDRAPCCPLLVTQFTETTSPEDAPPPARMPGMEMGAAIERHHRVVTMPGRASTFKA